jgi:hypothetical protein
MTRTRRFDDSITDLIAAFGGFTPFEAYNPDEFDLVPRKGYFERQIKEKEEELSRLKQRKANEQKFYENQEKSLTLEIEMLKQKLNGK